MKNNILALLSSKWFLYGVVLLWALVFAYVYYSRFIPWVASSGREKHVAELEQRVGDLIQLNENAEKEIHAAKARAETARQRHLAAEQRAVAAEARSELWRARHDKLVEERAQLAKITSDQEALAELRRLGWVR